MRELFPLNWGTQLMSQWLSCRGFVPSELDCRNRPAQVQLFELTMISTFVGAVSNSNCSRATFC